MKIIILVIVFLFFPSHIYANSVVINEVLIEPQQQVELINSGNETVDISNWYLDDSGGTTFVTIPTNTLIQPNSCLVFSENFNLNKTTTDTIRLFDNTEPPTSSNTKLIDSYTYDKSAGTNVSFSRLPDGTGSFDSAAQSIGFYNLGNNNCVFIPSPTPTIPIPTLTIIPTFTPTPTPVATIHNIYITEVMPNPEESSTEWVELYNNNNFTVHLDNWYIDDAENAGSSPKLFSTTIAAYSYGFVELSSSLFNNDADTARLLDSQKNERFMLEYSDTVKGYSLGSTIIGNTASFCIQESSKNIANKSCRSSITPPPTLGLTITPSVSGIPVDINSVILGETDSVVSLTPTPTPFIQPTPPVIVEESEVSDEPEEEEIVEIPSSPVHTPHLLQSFSITSFGFSVLSFISILFKIKNMA